MFLQEKASDINERLKVLKNISNIIIWGAGEHTRKLFEYTDMLSYTVSIIVDIDKQKQGNSYFGFIIQDPEQVAWEDIEAVVISVPGKELQIMNMLIDQFEFKGRIVTLYENNECTPFYLLYDENIPTVRYFGDYDNWNEAYSECKGYEDIEILNTVIGAVDRVVKGDAVWERDGYLFYEQKFVYSICAAILKCAVQNQNKGVRILDIGGALGSTYLQNKGYLLDIKNLEYIVAEQEHFADYGHRNLEDGKLKFIKGTDDWEKQKKFDIILLSASLQYISQYQEIISKIVIAQPHYIILDRIMVSDRMRICRETVPEYIYESSYPVRIFTENQIENFFGSDYEVIERDIASVPETPYFIDGRAVSRYYVLRLQRKW